MTAPTPQASTSATGRALFYQGNEVVHVDAATARGALDLAALYQPLDSDLTAIAALNTAAFGRGLLVLADAAAARATLLTPAISDVRERLTANRTYYVRTDGSDSNNGLSNTAGGAFLTVQKAIDVVTDTLDLVNFDVTIQVADGTYSGLVVLKGYVAAGGQISIIGNTATPGSVFFNATSGYTVSNVLGVRAAYTLKGFKCANTTGSNMRFEGRGIYVKIEAVDQGAAARQITAFFGAHVVLVGTNYVTGGAQHGFWVGRQSLIFMSQSTISFLNSPAFSVACFTSTESGWLDAHTMTFVNGATVTGKRYSADGLAGIFTNGGGASYVPGNVAGTVTNGGVYY